MDILSEILGLPAYLQLIEESIEPNSLSIELIIASTAQLACCPNCQKPSTKIGDVLDVLLTIQQTLSSKGFQLLRHTSATPPMSER